MKTFDCAPVKQFPTTEQACLWADALQDGDHEWTYQVVDSVFPCIAIYDEGGEFVDYWREGV